MLCRRPSLVPLALLAVVVLGPPALAHDFWIEPSSFAPTPGELVKLRLRVGQGFSGDAVPRFNDRIERFDATGADGTAPVLGFDGHDPAGLARFPAAGERVVVYRSVPEPIELPPEKFAAYLAAEGLDAVAAARARSGASGPARERFSRCAKALLEVGGAPGEVATRPVGLTLELVPETDPAAMSPGDRLTVRLLYLGKPLPGALVQAFDAEAAPTPQKARADAAGRASFVLPRAGTWLVKAVHMVPAASGGDAEWESFWASLTFALSPPR